MASLFIDRRGADMRLCQGCVRIESAGEVSMAPLSMVERVVLSAPATISSPLLAELAARRIPLAILAPRGRGNSSVLPPACGTDGARRLAQYRAYLDIEWRRRWSARTLRVKLAGQLQTLSAAAQQRPELRYFLDAASASMRETVRRLARPPLPALAELRGIEGAAAAAFFGAYARLFAPALAFHGRNRRPPRDPVNAALSLAYTLAYTESVRAAAAAGLDPLIGFYHDLRSGRQSLACDLCEFERGAVELWVWTLFRDRVVRLEHFHFAQGRCLLGKAGRRNFYFAIEPLLERIGKRQRRRCLALVKSFSQEEQDLGEHEDEDFDS